MNQEHVVNLSQIQNNYSTDIGMSDEAKNDIRRAIEQYHNPIAYYISFGLDQPGVRLVGSYLLELHTIDMKIELQRFKSSVFTENCFLYEIRLS
jgi:hypothetical protein